LFLSLLLTNSRLPFTLALDGHMPSALAAVHPRFGPPWVAVTVSSACYCVFAYWSFKELIVLDIWLYALTLLLELAAFVALRRREPDLPRPWRVGGGSAGMWAVVALPAGCGLLAMATAGWTNTLIGVLAALTGPLAFFAGRTLGRAQESVTPSPWPSREALGEKCGGGDCASSRPRRMHDDTAATRSAPDSGAKVRIGEQPSRPAHQHRSAEAELARDVDDQARQRLLAARDDLSRAAWSAPRIAEHRGSERRDARD